MWDRQPRPHPSPGQEADLERRGGHTCWEVTVLSLTGTICRKSKERTPANQPALIDIQYCQPNPEFTFAPSHSKYRILRAGAVASHFRVTSMNLGSSITFFFLIELKFSYRERERDQEAFYPLVHLPDDHNGQGRQERRPPSESSHVNGQAPSLWPLVQG